MIGAPGAGQSYVIFGSRTIGSSGVVQLLNLDGSNGFAMGGVPWGDYCGYSVADAGDVNNDGITDMIVGAPNVHNNILSGQSYVIFGSRTIGSSGDIQLSSLDGSNGFMIDGVDANDESGWAVASAGDVNTPMVSLI